MSNKQTQDVRENSTATQIGGAVYGDVVNNTHNGFGPQDIAVLFQHLGVLNVGQMQGVARQTFFDNLKTMAAEVKALILAEAQPIVPERLVDPHVQLQLVDAALSAGRLGERGNYVLLAQLITKQLTSTPNAFADQLISESLTVVPKLTPAQIEAVALAGYMLYHDPLDPRWDRLAGDAPAVGLLIKNYLSVTNPLAEVAHLIALGVASHPVRSFGPGHNSSFELLKNRFNRSTTSVADFAIMMAEKSPELAQLVGIHQTLTLSSIVLTPVGKLIAALYLQRAIPSLVVEFWIN